MSDADAQATRRTLLGSATLGAVMLGAFAGRAEAAGMTALEKANVKVVNAFLEAGERKDTPGSMTYIADDCVYRMTESSPPDKGHDAIVKRLAQFVDHADKIE